MTNEIISSKTYQILKRQSATIQKLIYYQLIFVINGVNVKIVKMNLSPSVKKSFPLVQLQDASKATQTMKQTLKSLLLATKAERLV